MARPPAPKQSWSRRSRQVLAGLAAIVSLIALLFAIFQWRVNTPEQHLNLGRIAADRPSAQTHE
jgi:hypothetical protein